MTGSEDVIPRALFEIAIQAVVGGKVVARETLSAMRKGSFHFFGLDVKDHHRNHFTDVTAGLYGGHHERKLKVSFS